MRLWIMALFWLILFKVIWQCQPIFRRLFRCTECQWTHERSSDAPNANERMNESAVIMVHKYLDSMSWQAVTKEFSWVNEMSKSRWGAICSSLGQSSTDVGDKTFQCVLRAIHLCFSYCEGPSSEAMWELCLIYMCTALLFSFCLFL